jgi:hypothetical protein
MKLNVHAPCKKEKKIFNKHPITDFKFDIIPHKTFCCKHPPTYFFGTNGHKIVSISLI